MQVRITPRTIMASGTAIHENYLDLCLPSWVTYAMDELSPGLN